MSGADYRQMNWAGGTAEVGEHLLSAKSLDSPRATTRRGIFLGAGKPRSQWEHTIAIWFPPGADSLSRHFLWSLGDRVRLDGMRPLEGVEEFGADPEMVATIVSDVTSGAALEVETYPDTPSYWCIRLLLLPSPVQLPTKDWLFSDESMGVERRYVAGWFSEVTYDDRKHGPWTPVEVVLYGGYDCQGSGRFTLRLSNDGQGHRGYYGHPLHGNGRSVKGRFTFPDEVLRTVTHLQKTGWVLWDGQNPQHGQIRSPYRESYTFPARWSEHRQMAEEGAWYLRGGPQAHTNTISGENVMG